MIKKLKTWSLVLYFLAFFTPIYHQTLFGIDYPMTVTDLGGRTMFIIVFLVVLGFAIYTIQFRQSLQNIAEYVAIGFMGLMLLIFVFLKDDAYTLGIAVFYQFVLLGFFIALKLIPDVIVSGLGVLGKLCLKLHELLDEKEQPEVAEESKEEVVLPVEEVESIQELEPDVDIQPDEEK